MNKRKINNIVSDFFKSSQYKNTYYLHMFGLENALKSFLYKKESKWRDTKKEEFIEIYKLLLLIESRR